MLRNALQNLAGLSAGGTWRSLAVTQAVPTSFVCFSTSEASAPALKRLWVGNLPWAATEKDVEGLFGAYGASSVYILRERTSNRSRGMALVSVEEGKAEQAIAEANGKEFQGRILKVAPSTVRREMGEKQPKEQAQPPAETPAQL